MRARVPFFSPCSVRTTQSKSLGCLFFSGSVTYAPALETRRRRRGMVYTLRRTIINSQSSPERDRRGKEKSDAVRKRPKADVAPRRSPRGSTVGYPGLVDNVAYVCNVDYRNCFPPSTSHIHLVPFPSSIHASKCLIGSLGDIHNPYLSPITVYSLPLACRTRGIYICRLSIPVPREQSDHAMIVYRRAIL